MAGIVAATAITKDENGCCVGIIALSLLLPPVAEAITGELAGVATATEIDEAFVEA